MDANETRVVVVGLEREPEHAEGRTHDMQVTTRLFPTGTEAKFKLSEAAALREVLEEGARRAGVTLLPPTPVAPLDRLRNILKHGQAGPPIDLAQPLGTFLKEKGTTKDFGIELVPAFQVNTRWAVATKPQMTPREILALPGINLDPTQYTLYPPESAKPLPLDEPVAVARGTAFEAQRDGKYGGCV